jgi:hypothetical protein
VKGVLIPHVDKDKFSAFSNAERRGRLTWHNLLASTGLITHLDKTEPLKILTGSMAGPPIILTIRIPEPLEPAARDSATLEARAATAVKAAMDLPQAAPAVRAETAEAVSMEWEAMAATVESGPATQPEATAEMAAKVATVQRATPTVSTEAMGATAATPPAALRGTPATAGTAVKQETAVTPATAGTAEKAETA